MTSTLVEESDKMGLLVKKNKTTRIIAKNLFVEIQ